MEILTLEQAAKLLAEKNNILVLMHESPDGDAIGSAYGLCKALQSLGKNAVPLCGDEIPRDYSYITENFHFQEFEPEFIVSVDLASTSLLSGKAAEYAEKIDLCIDHHGSNTGYASFGFVDGKSASCAEIIKDILELMKVKFTREIANAVFTGICTDTGCFKYSSVTPRTHRIAADLIEYGAESGMICRLMFDSKSRSRLAMEKMVLDTLKYDADGAIAFVCLTLDIMQRSGALPGDTEGVASIPRQIEGVKIGVTLKEKENGECRFSVRTSDDIDASEICKKFGGGGHHAAAGCSIYGEIAEAKEKMLAACREALEEKI